jgi:hypothetical protein
MVSSIQNSRNEFPPGRKSNGLVDDTSVRIQAPDQQSIFRQNQSSNQQESNHSRRLREQQLFVQDPSKMALNRSNVQSGNGSNYPIDTTTNPLFDDNFEEEMRKLWFDSENRALVSSQNSQKQDQEHHTQSHQHRKFSPQLQQPHLQQPQPQQPKLQQPQSPQSPQSQPQQPHLQQPQQQQPTQKLNKPQQSNPRKLSNKESRATSSQDDSHLQQFPLFNESPGLALSLSNSANHLNTQFSQASLSATQTVPSHPDLQLLQSAGNTRRTVTFKDTPTQHVFSVVTPETSPIHSRMAEDLPGRQANQSELGMGYSQPNSTREAHNYESTQDQMPQDPSGDSKSRILSFGAKLPVGAPRTLDAKERDSLLSTTSDIASRSSLLGSFPAPHKISASNHQNHRDNEYAPRKREQHRSDPHAYSGNRMQEHLGGDIGNVPTTLSGYDRKPNEHEMDDQYQPSEDILNTQSEVPHLRREQINISRLGSATPTGTHAQRKLDSDVILATSQSQGQLRYEPVTDLFRDRVVPSALDALRREGSLYVGHPAVSR